MKARIKKTGEILNVEPSVFNGIVPEPDWEQRRYEIARDCFPKAIEMAQSQTIYSCTSQRAAELAVIYANALITELKRVKK